MAVESLTALPTRSIVLIDANIFIYALRKRSAQCEAFLQRCRAQDLAGVTSLEVVNDVCHRLMLAEAMEEGIVDRATVAMLRRKYAAIKTLNRYWQLTSSIFEIDLIVISLEELRVRPAQRVRASYGLLTMDSLLVAAAEENGIKNVATLDSDFERVPELTVFKPTDLR